MMQNVATTKSEVAAFASGSGVNSINKPEPTEQFGKVMQNQKHDQSPAFAPEAPPPFWRKKLLLRQSVDEMQKNQPAPSEESKRSLDRKTAQEHSLDKSAPASNVAAKKTSSENADGITQKNLSSAKQDNAEQSSDKLGLGSKEQKLALTTNESEEVQLTLESDNIIAQEWVSLVDNLRKLAEGVSLTKDSTADGQANDIAKLLAGTDQLHSDVERQQKSNIVQDNTLLNGVPITDAENGLLEGKDGKVLLGKEQVDTQINANQSLDQKVLVVVQKALDQVLKSDEQQVLSESQVRQKTAESLLKQPDVLQNLLGQSAQAEAIKRFASNPPITPDSKLENLAKNDAPSTEVQVEKAGLVEVSSIKEGANASPLNNISNPVIGHTDVTLSENKALLSTLLDGIESGTQASQTKAEVAKPVLTAAIEQLDKVQPEERLVAKIGTLTEHNEILEQSVEVGQTLANNLGKDNKSEKVATSSDLKHLINLPEEKLTKVLENIAKRVIDNAQTELSVNPEAVVQQAVLPRAAEILASNEPLSKDFVLALKSGLEEFKQQLSQGREPGMDLKALMSEALAKTTDAPIAAKSPIKMEQIVNSVSQLLDFSQTMNRAIEQHHEQVYSNTFRDVAQIQGEQSKSLQFNQFEAKFEKAVNITKPEGHQQLAEKVRWMVNTKNLVADIRLDPAELGSVHVKVAMSGESATVNFVVQSQHARDAMDNATPRLREMLAEKGIELGQSSVEQESQGQSSQGEGELSQSNQQGQELDSTIDSTEQVIAQQSIVNGALGGIDYFV